MLLRNECQFSPFPCIKQICSECPYYFSHKGDQGILEHHYETAILDYLKAWELDLQNALSARTIGDLYSQKQDFAAANDWYRQAASLNDSIALFNLAENTRYGRGTPRDLEAAILLYQQAAQLDHPDARHAIGDLCVENGLIKVDLTEGLAHFHQDADREPTLARQRWLAKIRSQNKINFESLELIQLSQTLENLFPARPSISYSIRPTKPSNKFNDIRDNFKCEESTENIQRSWQLDVTLPELDPDLAQQTISQKQFARATQQYMIRFQNQHEQSRIDDFCAEIGITWSYYYKIIRNERRPNRDTAIALAVALGLNEHETQDYIMLLGDRLNEQLKRDWLIIECIRRHYTVDQTGQVLSHFGASPLVNIE